jgi:probable lipoprotein NlpC
VLKISLILIIFGVAFNMYSCTPLRPLAPYAAIRNIPQNSDVTGIATWDDVLVPWLGTPYLSGGTTKNGTDCSGFVSSVYLEKERMYIPRTTTEEYKMGKDVTRDNLVIGDLVFFGNGRRVSHVGIYVGRGNFIHASSSKGVTVSPLEDNYWKPKYMGARRYL